MVSQVIASSKRSALATCRFLEETVYHIVLAGIQSFEKHTKPQALLKNINDVSTLVDLCTTKESGQLAAVTNVCHSGPPRVAAIPAEEDAINSEVEHVDGLVFSSMPTTHHIQ